MTRYSLKRHVAMVGEGLGITAEITNEPILWLTPADGDQFIGTLNSWSIESDQLFGTAIVGRFSADSAEANLVYWENTFPFDFIDFTQLVEEAYFAQTWASDREGNVFIGPRDAESYQITGFDVNGADEPAQTDHKHFVHDALLCNKDGETNFR